MRMYDAVPAAHAPVLICLTEIRNIARLAYLPLARLREFAEKRGVVSLLPTDTVTTPFCVGVPVKRQQPIGVIIEMLTNIFFLDLTFQSDSCVNITKVNSNCIV